MAELIVKVEFDKEKFNAMIEEFKAENPDFVEVVRCRDCKHFGRNLENDAYCACVGGLTDPEEHDFCSYGERKEKL